jgi:hypothetical protein
MRYKGCASEQQSGASGEHDDASHLALYRQVVEEFHSVLFDLLRIRKESKQITIEFPLAVGESLLVDIRDDDKCIQPRLFQGDACYAPFLEKPLRIGDGQDAAASQGLQGAGQAPFLRRANENHITGSGLLYAAAFPHFHFPLLESPCSQWLDLFLKQRIIAENP